MSASGTARRMQMRYGFNEVSGWWHMALGPDGQRIRARLRLMDTRVVRIFAFDMSTPDPVKDWPGFAAYIQGVLDCGAVPMITFAKFPAPYDDVQNIRNFVARCYDIVWGCLQQWGGAAVKDWYWGVWNEPNNEVIGGGLSFEQYRRIYEAVARAIAPQLEPHMGGRRARIGGPAIDGTNRSYWMDWIARLIDEVDERLVSFVTWHSYGDWRPGVLSTSVDKKMWDAPEAPKGDVYEALLMAHTPTYEARARGVARLLAGRGIANFCGELNTIAHHENAYTLGLNQNLFGAAYYASALIHLIRGGAELEMRWSGVGPDDAYAVMTAKGDPLPAGLAKQLFAQHVRFGDLISFPPARPDLPGVDAIVAESDDGRRSAIFVNTSHEAVTLDAVAWDDTLKSCDAVLKLDDGTNERIVREGFDGRLRIEGYGVAVVTNRADGTIID